MRFGCGTREGGILMRRKRQGGKACDNGRMNRRLRSFAALLALAAMLFAPFAVAMHACPMDDMAMQDAAHSTDAPVSAGLCERHCTDGKVAVETVKPPPAYPLALVPALRIAPQPERDPHAAPWRKDGFLADPSPPFARFTVLRI